MQARGHMLMPESPSSFAPWSGKSCLPGQKSDAGIDPYDGISEVFVDHAVEPGFDHRRVPLLRGPTGRGSACFLVPDGLHRLRHGRAH